MSHQWNSFIINYGMLRCNNCNFPFLSDNPVKYQKSTTLKILINLKIIFSSTKIPIYHLNNMVTISSHWQKLTGLHIFDPFCLDNWHVLPVRLYNRPHIPVQVVLFHASVCQVPQTKWATKLTCTWIFLIQFILIKPAMVRFDADLPLNHLVNCLLQISKENISRLSWGTVQFTPRNLNGFLRVQSHDHIHTEPPGGREKSLLWYVGSDT